MAAQTRLRAAPISVAPWRLRLASEQLLIALFRHLLKFLNDFAVLDDGPKIVRTSSDTAPAKLGFRNDLTVRSASEVIRRITKTNWPQAPRGGADGDETAAANEGSCCGVKRPSLTRTFYANVC